jgi:ribosomal protein S18 acetylase RimI-like enzyme
VVVGGDRVNLRFRSLADAGEPTADLVQRIAPWVIAASRPFADWYFGEPDVAAEILGEWMGRPTSEVFAGRALLATTDDGAAVGCIIALMGRELARCRAADFAAFCEELGSEPGADDVIAEVLAASHELFPPVADDELYVSRVGVDPAQRGQGIGRALVGAAIDAFRDQHPVACRLDVSADNASAIRAYEAAGLAVISTSHSETAGLTYCAMRTVS